MGSAGGSARQENERRAREWALMRQRFPITLAIVLGITLLVFVAVILIGTLFFHAVEPKGQQSTGGSLASARLAVWVFACIAALCAGGSVARPAWRRQATEAFAGGLEGKARTAHLLAPLERDGWVALHGLRVPGSRASIDHVMVGPPGVFVVDSKDWSGTVEVTADTVLHSGQNRERELAALLWEASAVDQALREGLAVAGIQAVAVLCVHGARVTRPRGRSDPRYGVQVLGAGQLVAWLLAQPPCLRPGDVAGLAELCTQRLARPPAA